MHLMTTTSFADLDRNWPPNQTSQHIANDAQKAANNNNNPHTHKSVCFIGLTNSHQPLIALPRQKFVFTFYTINPEKKTTSSRLGWQLAEVQIEKKQENKKEKKNKFYVKTSCSSTLAR